MPDWTGQNHVRRQKRPADQDSVQRPAEAKEGQHLTGGAQRVRERSPPVIDDEYQALMSFFYCFDSFFLNLAAPVLSFIVPFATQM